MAVRQVVGPGGPPEARGCEYHCNMPGQQTSRLTNALLRPETAAAAAEALRGAVGKAEVEGLVELLYAPPSAPAAVAAVSSLDASGAPIVVDALIHALDSPHSSVRTAAVQSLHRRGTRRADEALLRLLRRDESWGVRRAALLALADRPEPRRWDVLPVAGTDPHGRVRHVLIQVLLQGGDTEARRREIDERLAGVGPDARVGGVREYLRYRWSGRPPTSTP